MPPILDAPEEVEKTILWYLARVHPNHAFTQEIKKETDLPISSGDYEQVLLRLLANGEIYKRGDNEYQLSHRGKERIDRSVSSISNKKP
jgi:hypothetical protein